MQPGAASEPEPDPLASVPQDQVESKGLPQTASTKDAPPPKNTKVRGRKTRPARGVQFR